MGSSPPSPLGAMWTLWRRRPDLVLAHAHAYADLARQESAAWAAFWLGRLMWVAGAVFLGAVGLTLAGVAIMLAGFGSPNNVALVAVPGCTLAAAAVCAWLGMRGPAAPALEALRAQWDEDCRMLAPEEP